MAYKNIMLAGAAALALTGAAAADTPAGFYLDLGAGANWVQDIDQPMSSFDDFDMGYYVGGTAGYKIDNGLKFEFEVAYRSNDFDLFRGKTAEVNSFSVMGNMLYDIDLGPGYSLSLGGGVGTARIGFDAAPFLDDRDWVFAFQGLAEIEAMVSDDIGVFAGYNYFEANNAFDDTDGFDYKAHTALVGVRFHFIEAEAPPPPPPPPPPVAAKTFIVFFNFDKSDLTPEAQAVVAEAAAAFKSTGSVSIAVVGHTDTVGSAAYNLPLSERRAASVKAGLVANGVPGDVVSTSGKGFSEPLVPTGPGVKEPQNRRATIDLTGSAM